MERIESKTSLTSLYTIHSATNFDYFDRYCGIILRLGYRLRKVYQSVARSNGLTDEEQSMKIEKL